MEDFANSSEEFDNLEVNQDIMPMQISNSTIHTCKLEHFPQKLTYRSKFFYSLFFVIIPLFLKAISVIIWALSRWPKDVKENKLELQTREKLLDGQQKESSKNKLSRLHICFSVLPLVFIWPAFQMIKSCKQRIQTLYSRAHDRQKMNEKAIQYTINKSYAHLMEVIVESSFQPLLQWYIVFPGVYSLLQDDNEKKVESFFDEEAFNNILQFSSWVVSLISLAWSFTSYNAAMKKGALCPDVNPAGRGLVFLSNLCLIFVRMNFIIFFMYSWGPGHFYPGVLAIVIHAFVMGLLHIKFLGFGQEITHVVHCDADVTFSKRIEIFLKITYSSIVNGLANIYCHNYVETQTEQKFKSFFHKIPTFLRQFIFDIIFLAENIAITIIAIMNIPVKPFSDIHEQSRLFAILFFIHFLGLTLKIMYYKFFHIWKDITTRLDFDTRSFYRGDEELDYSCMCPTLNYDMCCCQK